jgi:diguanylate cyclase (GGDEF)-like protein
MSSSSDIEALSARLLALAEQAIDFTAYLDESGKIRWMSDAFLSFTGGDLRHLFGRPLSDLVSPLEKATLVAALTSLRGGAPSIEANLTLTGKTEVSVPVAVRLIKVADGSGQLLFTANRRELKVLAIPDLDLTSKDAVTGLDSRISFSSQLQAALTSDKFALLLINIDRFKRINESLGTRSGDAILKAVATRLSRSIREYDVLSRLAADEFAVILKNVSDRAILGELAARFITLLGQPFELAGERLRLSVSIGVAMYPGHGESEEHLIRAAELAVESAKARGGNQWCLNSCVYTPDRSKLTLETSLHEAVEQGQLSLHYQPIVDRDGKLAGCEALMRWQHPDKGFISPAEFIPAAEACGLIHLLGNWSLRLACAQAAKWPSQDLYMSVNVSPKQFLKEGFETAVTEALAGANLDPSRLMLEITEGVLMLDPCYSKALLERLRSLGIRVAVDDFGTGYSSLAYLKTLPVSSLKVDRSFVMGLPDDSQDRAIVASVLGMTQQLGMFSIVEGVETQAQADTVRELGCTYMQGWLYGKPLPADEFEARFLKEA